MNENKTEYVKKSDILKIINKYEKTSKKVYRDDPEIRSLNLNNFKSEILALKTYYDKKV